MTINDIAVSSVLMFGTFLANYGGDVGEPITWIKATGTNVFMSARYLGRFQFDESESASGVEVHRDNGNNFYPESNIDQLLNSSGVNWFSPKHSADRCFSTVAQTRGFLDSFTPEERALIVPRKIKYVTPRGLRRQHGAVMEIERLVSLPSASELGIQGAPDEGEGFPAYLDGPLPRTMLRTAVGQASYATALDRTNLKNRRANDFERITPVIQLAGEAEVESYDGIYYLADPQGMPQELLDVLSAVA